MLILAFWDVNNINGRKIFFSVTFCPEKTDIFSLSKKNFTTY